MKKNTVSKGSFGYIKSKRFFVTSWTILLFAVALSLYFAGYVATGSNKNVLTLVAVFGILPASRSAVTAFMYFKAKPCTDELKNKYEKILNTCNGCYDLVFTTYEKSYNVPCLAIKSGNLCGLSFDKNRDFKELQKHIESCLKKEGYSANIVIFDKEEDFAKRLKQLTQLEEKEKNHDLEMKRIIFEITL